MDPTLPNYMTPQNSSIYVPQHTVLSNNPQLLCDYCHSSGGMYYYFPMCLKYHIFHPNCFTYIQSTTPPAFCWKCTTDASRQILYDQSRSSSSTSSALQWRAVDASSDASNIVNEQQIEAQITIEPPLAPNQSQDISFVSSRAKRILVRSCIIFSFFSVSVFLILYFFSKDNN